MKQFDNITDNAKSILQNFRESCLDLAKKSKIHTKKFTSYLDDTLVKALSEHATIDAEVAMNEIDKLGKAENVVANYQEISTGKPQSTVSKKLLLSTSDRLLGGVCGGVAEYFQVDALLVRAGFLAGFFLAGFTLFLYAVLWVIMHDRDKIKDYPPLVAIIFEVVHIAKKIISPIVCSLLIRSPKVVSEPNSIPVSTSFPEPKNMYVNKTTENVIPQKNKKGIISRFFAFIFFGLLSIVLYLPLLILLLGIACFCVWGIFYTVIDLEGFRFSFTSLDIPGIVAGISIATSSFFLFLLLAYLVWRMHLGSKILSKNLLTLSTILFIVSLFAAASAVSIVVFNNKVLETSVVTKDFVLDKEVLTISHNELEYLNHLNIKFNDFIVYGEDNRQNVTVKVVTRATGESRKQARNHIENMVVEWLDDPNVVLPRVTKINDEFHFETLKFEVFVPANKGINIEGVLNCDLELSGKIKSVSLDIQNTTVIFNESEIEKIMVQGEDCKLNIKNSKINEIVSSSQESHFFIDDTIIESSSLHNTNNLIRLQRCKGVFNAKNSHSVTIIEDCSGNLNIENYKGKMKFLRFDFISKSESIVSNNDGELEMFFLAKNLPQVHVENDLGRVENRIPNFSTTDAIVKLNNQHGRVLLDTKHH